MARRMAGRFSKNSQLLLLPLVVGVIIFAGFASLSRCFSPTLPACSFICSPTEPRCPDEYECRSDNYCHLRDSSEACPYSMDLAAGPQIDLASSPDLASPPDMSLEDM